jgi:hypothetical protein
MLKIFNSNNPVLIILLFIYGILIRLFYFIYPGTVSGIISFHWTGWGSSIPEFILSIPWLSWVLGYLLTFIIALLFNNFLNTHRFLPKQNYYPTLLFITFTAIYSETNSIQLVQFSVLLLLLLCSKFVDSYRKDHALDIVFDCGLIVGLLILLQPNNFPFIILLFFGLFIFRSVQTKEWLATSLGIFIIPFLFFTWFFYCGQLLLAASIFFKNIGFNFQTIISLPTNYWYKFIALGLIIIVSGLYYISSKSSRLVLVSKIHLFFFHYTWIALVVFLIQKQARITTLYLLAIPCTFYVAYYLCSIKRSWVGNILMYLQIISILIFQYIIK